ncbi:MAG: hypothetical protein ACYC21_04645 [Eubacteriales bacterium]|nr:hypothetical protein [Bacillota bacterium]
MKEVVTKFLLIIIAVYAVVSFVYGTLWDDAQTVRNSAHSQIDSANPRAPGATP